MKVNLLDIAFPVSPDLPHILGADAGSPSACPAARQHRLEP